MAYLATEALLCAICEVIEGRTGDLDRDTYMFSAWALQDRNRESRFALCTPLAEARFVSKRKHPASTGMGCRGAGMLLYEVTIEIRLVRHVNNLHACDKNERMRIKALAARDGDVLCQALGQPDVLLRCVETGEETCLSGGMLQYDSSTFGELELADNVPDGGRLVSTHRFTGVMKVEPSAP